MDKYIGKRLDGRYEIKEIIGVGGMAVVYKAYDNIDDRMVAVKILKEELLADDDLRRRFKNESKAIAVLSHPNIVKVYDVSFGDRLQYLVMEYIDGITLKEYIAQQKVIGWKDALHFTVQILRALQHAHDKGIVHRDIKPQNIMLLSDGTIKVTDFGIARFARNEQRTMTDKAIGSVHYISPEQARGDVTDAKSDIYSVGVLLYEMLTGRLPFEADSAVSVAIMQMQSTPKMPREINPEIPEGLEEITIKAMQKEPKMRYQSAAEMLADIERFKLDPDIVFGYRYFVDNEPTKYIPTSEVISVSGVKNDSDTDDDDDGDSSNQGRSKFMPVLVGVTSAFIIGIVALAIFLTGPSVFGLWGKPSGGVVECPTLIGLEYNAVIADDNYKQYKIKLNSAKNAYSTEYESGIIMWQSPDPGKSIKGEKVIEVAVSLGSKQIKMTDYRNYAKSAVIKSLESLGVKYTVEEVYSDDIAKDFVVRTNPAGGLPVDSDTTVTIYVSKGGVPQVVQVQNFVGLMIDEAKRQVEDNGLKVGNITEKESNDYPAGYVINQSLSSRSSVNKDSVVDLTVSKGRPSYPVKVKMPIPSKAVKKLSLEIFYNGQSIHSTTIDPTAISGSNKYVELQLTADMFNPASSTPTIMVKLGGHQYMEYMLNFTEGTYAKLKTFNLPEDVLKDPEVSSTVSSEPSAPSSDVEPDDSDVDYD